MDIMKGLLLPFWWAWQALCLLADFVVWIIGHPAWREKKQEKPLGSAEWATDKELKQAGRLEPVGWLIGVTESGSHVYTDKESSAVLIAQKGLGKSLSIEAHVRSYKRRLNKPDVVVYNPKGKSARAMKPIVEAMGFTYCEMDLTNPDASSVRYNPMSILRLQDTYDVGAQIRSMVNLLAPMAQVGHSNQHFESFPQIMLRGVIKFKLLTNPNPTLYDAVRTLIIKKHRDAAFKKMATMESDPQIQAAVEAWNGVSDKERGSFISSNLRKVEYWISPLVHRMTECKVGEEKSISWTWEDMFKYDKPLYLTIISDLQAEDGEFVRLIIGNLINSAKRWFRDHGRLPKGLDIIIDEANTLGPCGALVDVNRTLREAGVNTFQCWLQLQDMKAHYADWKTMLDGSDVIAFGNSGDWDYYEYVSRRLRHTTVMARGESESDHGEGRNRHEHRKRLMEPDDMGALKFHECVASIRSGNGLLSFKGLKPFDISGGNGLTWR